MAETTETRKEKRQPLCGSTDVNDIDCTVMYLSAVLSAVQAACCLTPDEDVIGRGLGFHGPGLLGFISSLGTPYSYPSRYMLLLRTDLLLTGYHIFISTYYVLPRYHSVGLKFLNLIHM